MKSCQGFVSKEDMGVLDGGQTGSEKVGVCLQTECPFKALKKDVSKISAGQIDLIEML